MTDEVISIADRRKKVTDSGGALGRAFNGYEDAAEAQKLAAKAVKQFHAEIVTRFAILVELIGRERARAPMQKALSLMTTKYGLDGPTNQGKSP